MPRHTRITLLVVGVLIVYLTLLPRFAESRIPGNNIGYSPEQPIAYSHRLHAGELEIPCLYCHSGAERGRHAGIPSADVCMRCHKSVQATFGALRAEEELAKEEGREPRQLVSPELTKLYDALGLDADLKRDESKALAPIHWKQVHRLPDFVYFDHSVHVRSGVACQSCHGAVEAMERVRQHETLRMGWCIDCHRDVNVHGVNGKAVDASLDCAACHY